VFVEFPQAVHRKLLALQRASHCAREPLRSGLQRGTFALPGRSAQRRLPRREPLHRLPGSAAYYAAPVDLARPPSVA
jgi:hypothetical protein